ncbi:hypothetical protein GN956_G9113 [Arapaima gigas]
MGCRASAGTARLLERCEAAAKSQRGSDLVGAAVSERRPDGTCFPLRLQVNEWNSILLEVYTVLIRGSKVSGLIAAGLDSALRYWLLWNLRLSTSEVGNWHAERPPTPSDASSSLVGGPPHGRHFCAVLLHGRLLRQPATEVKRKDGGVAEPRRDRVRQDFTESSDFLYA